MSDSDHLVIKRVVRAVLRDAMREALDALADRASVEVIAQLQQECGADRLYVPADTAARRADRDRRIRASFADLCRTLPVHTALKRLALKEGLSVKQLRRICTADDGDCSNSLTGAVAPKVDK